MHVVMISGSYPPMRCGVGDYTAQLSRALCEEPGVTVEVVTSATAGKDSGSCASVEPVMEDWKLQRTFQLLRTLRRARPDIVHVQYPTQGYRAGKLPEFAPLLARLLGAKVVQTWHEPITPRGLPSLLIRLSALPRVIVVRTDFLGKLRPAVRWLLGATRLQYIAGGSAIPSVALSPEERIALRRRYVHGPRRLIVYFGFVYPHKGVDLLFDIADPQTDFLLIIGDAGTDPTYSAVLAAKSDGRWKGNVAFEGYLGPREVAERLRSSDAVVLPFRLGGGEWNSSIHAARANGAYIVTTSANRRDYDASTGTAHCPVDDVGAMRQALALASSRQRPDVMETSCTGSEWTAAARAHLAVYRQILSSGRHYGKRVRHDR